MELFTLGVGNYTEADVKALARAFTGWRVRRATGEVRFVPALHDDGAKTVLGHTANLDAAGAVALVTSQPVAASFLASRMWSFFATPVAAGDPAVVPLAAVYARARTGAALVRAVLQAGEFSGEAVRGGLVKTPIEYVVGSLRALRLEPQARATSTCCGGSARCRSRRRASAAGRPTPPG
jgi:uncharacterized protein (DUF1800 family)